LTQQSTVILIVDDEPKNIQLMANLLREYNFIIEYATSGSMALQWVQRRTFDLILLDILMPGMDGFEGCRRLKANADTASIPVIFLTARANPADLVEAFSLGAADYVTKPFHKEELLARVNAHVTLGRQRAELARTAQLLEEKADQLSKENASKDKLISILAHDLRNPLVGILDFARLLENVELIPPTTLHKLSIEFHMSAERMLALVDNLLSWSRAQRGLLIPHPAQVSLHQVIQGRIELTAVGARQKSILLSNQVSVNASVWCDPDMLGAIIDNLLVNAVKFTNMGGQVIISAHPVGDTMQIEIADSGIGMSPETIQNLFQPGIHNHRTGTAGERGTGLGLAITREFVEANNGKIWVKSEVGLGSTFFVAIPARSTSPAV